MIKRILLSLILAISIFGVSAEEMKPQRILLMIQTPQGIIMRDASIAGLPEDTLFCTTTIQDILAPIKEAICFIRGPQIVLNNDVYIGDEVISIPIRLVPLEEGLTPKESENNIKIPDGHPIIEPDDSTAEI